MIAKLPIPDNIRDALAAVKVTEPDAVVAGGCLRDCVLSRPYRDIDIYVGPDFDPGPMRTLRWHVEVSASDEEVDKYRNYYGNGLVRVWLATPPNPGALKIPVQIVQRDERIEADKVLAGFDLNFCQIAWDGGAEVTWTPGFVEAIETKVATCLLAPDDSRMEKSRERADAFRLRFPGWTFVYPPAPNASFAELDGATHQDVFI